MKAKVQIRDIVKATGIPRETLRFYEGKGLLPEPERTEAGYRQFDSSIIDRLKFIRLAQEVGFSLKEIAGLLSLGQSKPVSRTDLKRIADSKIASIDERIRSLKAMRKILMQLSLTASRLTKRDSCPVLRHFKNLEL